MRTLFSLVLAAVTVIGVLCGRANAADKEAFATTARIDRVIVRFHSAETGGSSKPRFIFERELAFLARLEKLGDRDADEDLSAYRPRDITAALHRLIAETLLASLEVYPPVSSKTVAERAEAVRRAIETQTGSGVRIAEALAEEGIASDEFDEMLRRRARASLYIEKMMLQTMEPTESELRTLYRNLRPVLGSTSYEESRPHVLRHYLSRRLSQAVEAYYQSARPRIALFVMP